MAMYSNSSAAPAAVVGVVRAIFQAAFSSASLARSTSRCGAPAALILALGGLKVRRIDSEQGYFRAELTVIPSVCGDSGEIDSELARHLRLSFGQAEGKECALPDGRLWHGGVFGVLHAKPILPGASAPTGGGSRVWPLELRDVVR